MKVKYQLYNGETINGRLEEIEQEKLQREYQQKNKLEAVPRTYYQTMQNIKKKWLSE